MSIDVLAVIARSSHTLRDWGLPYQELVAAHDAVAELIEAVGDTDGQCVRWENVYRPQEVEPHLRGLLRRPSPTHNLRG